MGTCHTSTVYLKKSHSINLYFTNPLLFYFVRLTLSFPLYQIQSLHRSFLRILLRSSSQSIHTLLRSSRMGLHTPCRIWWYAILSYLSSHGFNNSNWCSQRNKQPFLCNIPSIFSHRMCHVSCCMSPNRSNLKTIDHLLHLLVCL